MKIFGFLCYASTKTASRTKFETHANKCVFLSYHVGVKGYKLLDLITHKVFLSRNVFFYETEFPLKTNQVMDKQDTLVLSDPIFNDLVDLYNPHSSFELLVTSTNYIAQNVNEKAQVINSMTNDINVSGENEQVSKEHATCDTTDDTSHLVDVYVITGIKRSTRVRKQSSSLDIYQYDVPPSLKSA